MTRTVRGLALVALALFACDGNNLPLPTSTAAPPVTTTTTIQPRVDQPPDLYAIRGVTAFGAAALSEQELVAFVHHIQAGGYNTLRAGAQTDRWCSGDNPYLVDACGPPALSSEWRANLERLLDVTSRIPGVWLQIIPTFTHKADGHETCARIMDHVIEIVMAGSLDGPTPYRHVIWEAVNEYEHPMSRLTREDVVRLLRRLKETGLPLGTDFSGGRDRPWEGYYPPELLPWVDYVAFHPPRNSDDSGQCEDIRPGPARLRRIIARFGKPVWIDEPTCWVSDQNKEFYGIRRDLRFFACAGSTEKRRKELARAYKADVEAAGGIWFAHAVWLFACRFLGWLP